MDNENKLYELSLDDLKLHDLEEVSELSGVTTRNLRSLIAKGKLPATKIARKWKVREIDLKKFLLGEFENN